jgi:hypothetical protein
LNISIVLKTYGVVINKKKYKCQIGGAELLKIFYYTNFRYPATV